MRPHRPIFLGIVTLTGLATLLASSLTEEDEPRPPPPPVLVTFTLTTPTAPGGLEREIDTRSSTVSGLSFNGSYDSTQGSNLTLDRRSVDVAINTAFTLAVEAKDPADDPFAGTAEIDVTQPLDVGLGHDPVAGQFSSLFDGTTTLVTATGSGVDVAVGAAAPEAFGWNEFEGFEDDTNRSDDLRMASAAYNMIEVILRAALIGEDIIDEIEQNEQMFEDMNFPSSLTLACDNGVDQGDSDYSLAWTTDANGAGLGQVGAGDGFVAEFVNCLRDARGRFLDEEVRLSAYVPQEGSGLRQLGITLDFTGLFVSENQVGAGALPDESSPLYDGMLTLQYLESAVSR